MIAIAMLTLASLWMVFIAATVLERPQELAFVTVIIVLIDLCSVAVGMKARVSR